MWEKIREREQRAWRNETEFEKKDQKERKSRIEGNKRGKSVGGNKIKRA